MARKTKQNRVKAARKGTTAPNGLGGLAAAATVLLNAGKPMGCKELVAQMLTRKLWSTKGKTPAATIGAAISRDISAKKDQSRFRKAGPGRFTLRTRSK